MWKTVKMVSSPKEGFVGCLFGSYILEVTSHGSIIPEVFGQYLRYMV